MGTMAFDHHRQRAPSILRLAALLTAASLLAGCARVAPTSPATAAPPSSASASAAVQSTVPATATATSSPGETPTTPAAAPLPSVGTTPSGNWSVLRWISAGPVFPVTPDTSAAPRSVVGWSRGYVGFRSTIREGQAVPSSVFSPDGLRWVAGQPLDISGLSSEVGVGAIEGPSGLLAMGGYPSGTCGGPSPIAALWTSTDGLAWSRAPMPSASANVYMIDGDSNGFIASGTLSDGTTPAVWLSGDGRSWRQIPLPGPNAGGIVVDGATTFAGGYVLSGAQRVDVGCGASEFVPSLWWSTDGRAWTRSQLAGAVPASNVQVITSRISDHALMAIAMEWNDAGLNTQLVWVTADGGTWKLVKSPSSLLGYGVLTDGQRGLAISLPPDNQGPPTLATVGDDLSVTILSQTGDGPIASDSSPAWSFAFGPTGVLVYSLDGSNLWLGVPTAA